MPREKRLEFLEPQPPEFYERVAKLRAMGYAIEDIKRYMVMAGFRAEEKEYEEDPCGAV